VAKEARGAGKAPALRGRPAEVVEWLRREILDQERRYRRIVREMDALEARRRRWILEFYRRIQTTGFNVHADVKRVIPPGEVPPLPGKRIRVVF
jgi:hypothetical protein